MCFSVCDVGSERRAAGCVSVPVQKAGRVFPRLAAQQLVPHLIEASCVSL